MDMNEILRKMKPTENATENVLSIEEGKMAMDWIKSFKKYNYSERLLIKSTLFFRGLIEVNVSVNDEVYHFYYRTWERKI